MSARLNDSKLCVLIVSSKISGAMYLQRMRPLKPNDRKKEPGRLLRRPACDQACSLALCPHVRANKLRPPLFGYKTAFTGYLRRPHLLVPTRWLDGMSMVSEVELCLTAKPRSAMAAVPFFFTRMFLDFRSLWAMAGFPGWTENHTSGTL